MNKVNVNTKEYWDHRFGSGDWEKKGGVSQTMNFALSQIKYFDIPNNFSGIICDFGCGTGDAFPIYSKYFPKARLFGVDFSKDAISACQNKYSSLGTFQCDSFENVPLCDILICSNVIEHIENDIEVITELKKKCKILYIIVPFNEVPLSNEHLRTYSDKSFNVFTPNRVIVYLCKGWSKYGFDLFFNVYFKNIFRFIFRRQLRKQLKQILFEIPGEL
jgi:ubiquinone/menaquinone biosynthesis C-methylase UbiE